MIGADFWEIIPKENKEFPDDSTSSPDQVVYDINFISVGFFFLSLPLLFINSLLRTQEQEQTPSHSDSSDSIENHPEYRNEILASCGPRKSKRFVKLINNQFNDPREAIQPNTRNLASELDDSYKYLERTWQIVFTKMFWVVQSINIQIYSVGVFVMFSYKTFLMDSFFDSKESDLHKIFLISVGIIAGIFINCWGHVSMNSKIL